MRAEREPSCMRRRARLPALLLLAGACLACCSEAEKGSEALTLAPGVLVFVANDGKPAEAPKDWHGIVVEIESSVSYESTLRITIDGTDQEVVTLNGQPFEVRGAEIHIGPSVYGPVRAGDRVSIASDGVRVNGALLGPLP